jgi:hypothetical protein
LKSIGNLNGGEEFMSGFSGKIDLIESNVKEILHILRFQLLRPLTTKEETSNTHLMTASEFLCKIEQFPPP